MSEWDLASGTDCDSTPPKVLSPCKAGLGLLLFHSTYTLVGGASGPCTAMSAWVLPITVGHCQG